jgi:hypothetical protein
MPLDRSCHGENGISLGMRDTCYRPAMAWAGAGASERKTDADQDAMSRASDLVEGLWNGAGERTGDVDRLSIAKVDVTRVDRSCGVFGGRAMPGKLIIMFFSRTSGTVVIMRSGATSEVVYITATAGAESENPSVVECRRLGSSPEEDFTFAMNG